VQLTIYEFMMTPVSFIHTLNKVNSFMFLHTFSITYASL